MLESILIVLSLVTALLYVVLTLFAVRDRKIRLVVAIILLLQVILSIGIIVGIVSLKRSIPIITLALTATTLCISVAFLTPFDSQPSEITPFRGVILEDDYSV